MFELLPNQFNTGALLSQGLWDTLNTAPSPNNVTLIPSPLLRILQAPSVVSHGNVGASTATPWLDATADFSMQMNVRSSEPAASNAGSWGLLLNGSDPAQIVQFYAGPDPDTGPNLFSLYATAEDGVNFDLIIADSFSAAADTWHSVYLTLTAGNWEIYLDGALKASVPATVNLNAATFTPSVQTDAKNLLWLPWLRYANWAQPPVAIQAAAFSGPIV